MALFLSQLGYLELSALGKSLRGLTKGCGTLESYANLVCRHLHEGLIEEDDRPSTALVRCFLTLPFKDLPSELAILAQRWAGVPLAPDSACLVLLGTAGLEPNWNHRTLSCGHQVFPLVNPEALNRLPMIRELLAQLQLEVQPIDPTVPVLKLGDARRRDQIFFIQDALSSPHIPSKTEFIVPYGVTSVLGFGDLVENEQGFAVLLFSRPKIGADIAPSFRILTRHVRNGIDDLRQRPVFES